MQRAREFFKKLLELIQDQNAVGPFQKLVFYGFRIFLLNLLRVWNINPVIDSCFGTVLTFVVAVSATGITMAWLNAMINFNLSIVVGAIGGGLGLRSISQQTLHTIDYLLFLSFEWYKYF